MDEQKLVAIEKGKDVLLITAWFLPQILSEVRFPQLV